MRWLFFALIGGCSALTDLGDLGADASTDARVDAGDVSDASSPKVIRCGTASCDPSASDCCATCDEEDGSNACFYTFSCVDSGIACPLASKDLDFGCSDPASCAANEVCCGILGNVDNEYFHYAKCMTAAACDASAPSVLLCDPNAPSCPQGSACKADQGRVPVQGMFVCE